LQQDWIHGVHQEHHQELHHELHELPQEPQDHKMNMAPRI
jgi:hypothetical protein